MIRTKAPANGAKNIYAPLTKLSIPNNGNANVHIQNKRTEGASTSSLRYEICSESGR